MRRYWKLKEEAPDLTEELTFEEAKDLSQDRLCNDQNTGLQII
jgi:hypothetical protein